jgi:hypothetical protein
MESPMYWRNIVSIFRVEDKLRQEAEEALLANCCLLVSCFPSSPLKMEEVCCSELLSGFQTT